MDELLARGLKSVPVTIWNDDVVIGFNPKELARLLDLNSEIAVVDLPTMLEKYETILTGAARAIRQIPEEKGEWESPERQRTIRQFTFHLCDRPDRALNAHDVGRYATEDRGREVEQVLGGKASFEEIAQYGEDVLRRIKAALAQPISLDLDKVLETYMGDKTAGEMLDWGWATQCIT